MVKGKVKNAEAAIEKVKDTVQNISTEISASTVLNKDISNLVDDIKEPIKKSLDSIKEIENDKNKLEEKINNSPEQVESILKDEIEKAQDKVKEIEKKITQESKISNSTFTNFWNGQCII